MEEDAALADLRAAEEADKAAHCACFLHSSFFVTFLLPRLRGFPPPHTLPPAVFLRQQFGLINCTVTLPEIYVQV